MKHCYFVSFFAVALTSVACGSSAMPEGAADGDQVDETPGEAEGSLSFKRSKRDYCCITKNALGILKCKRQRNYKDELGRISARAQCEGWYAGVGIDLAPTGGSGDPNKERTYDFVAATCDDRPECSQALNGIE